MDAVVEVRNSIHVGPFQTEILEGKISQAPTHDTHVMVTPLGCVELKRDGGHQLPPGLQVLHVYTTLTAGCKQISIVARNMTEQAIFLKKGVRVGTCCICNVSTPRTSTLKTERRHARTKGTYDCARATGQIVGEIEPKRFE